MSNLNLNVNKPPIYLANSSKLGASLYGSEPDALHHALAPKTGYIYSPAIPDGIMVWSLSKITESSITIYF